MTITYLDAISRRYPAVKVSCQGFGNTYSNLIWESGDPLPSQSVLDDAILDCIKEDKWLQIKAERDKRKVSGVRIPITTDTGTVYKWFHSDDTSRIQQIGLLMMGQNLPANLQWKTMDNSYVTMTPALAVQIFQAVSYYDITNFGVAEQHRLAMLSSNDPANYDYSSGWLPMYGE